MKQLFQWIEDLESYSGYKDALKDAQILKNYFNVKHFWYFKLTDQGKYSYFGSHRDWNRYCIDQNLIKPCLNLKNPLAQNNGIHFVASGADSEGKSILKTAWEQYQINFNVNFSEQIPGGVESFGFATGSQDALMTERLLNDQSLIKHYIKRFKKSHTKLFAHIDHYHLDLKAVFGTKCTTPSLESSWSCERNVFLKGIGFKELSSVTLTAREKEVLALLVNGFSAPYIAKSLFLSTRTIENYMANIKAKLNVDTKSELIIKAKNLQIIGKL